VLKRFWRRQNALLKKIERIAYKELPIPDMREEISRRISEIGGLVRKALNDIEDQPPNGK